MKYRAQPGRTVYGEAIGIIMMDTFMAFPPGSPGNASTFSYPVRYRTVRGLDMQKVVFAPDPGMLDRLLDAGRELVAEGVRAVTGNCGFMILYQEAMARELPVPVFMSSLLQLPLVARMLRPDQKIGIVSASAGTLSPEHLRIALRGQPAGYVLAGMEAQPAFRAAIIEEQGELDFERIEQEVVSVARAMIADDPAIGALLFECTDLPPYAAAVQAATGLPVFDYSTLIDFVFSAVVHRRFGGFM